MHEVKVLAVLIALAEMNTVCDSKNGQCACTNSQHELMILTAERLFNASAPSEAIMPAKESAQCCCMAKQMQAAVTGEVLLRP